MGAVSETLLAALQRWPYAFAFWAALAILPIATATVIALAPAFAIKRRFRFFWASAAGTLGHPLLLGLLFSVPWFSFQVLLIPVLLDVYPNAKGLLAVPQILSSQVLAHWWWVAPLAWVVWVPASALHTARVWSSVHAAET